MYTIKHAFEQNERIEATNNKKKINLNTNSISLVQRLSDLNSLFNQNELDVLGTSSNFSFRTHKHWNNDII
jgi:hypothetical protein